MSADSERELLAHNLDLQRQLHQRSEEARQERMDPGTSLLRHHALMEHLDALLRAKLNTAGAHRLLDGADIETLSDDEYEDLLLSVVFLGLSYPNPLIRSMPFCLHAMSVLGQYARLRVHRVHAGGQIVGVDAEALEIAVPKTEAGEMDGWVILVLADTPHVIVSMAKRIALEVWNAPVRSDLSPASLPFRVDYGGAIFAETLRACHFVGRGQRLDEKARLELVRRTLLGIARERAEHSRLLETVKLTVRLMHRREPAFVERILPFLGEGELATEETLLNALLVDSCEEGSFTDGRPNLDRDKLLSHLRAFGEIQVNARLARLNRNATLRGKTPVSRARFERLVLLAAHNRLHEFGDV